MQSAERARIARLLEAGAGALVVTGPRGSGKSTLLAAAVESARSSARHRVVMLHGSVPGPMRQLLVAMRHDLAGPSHPASVVEAVAAVGKTKPVLIVADDAHRFDPEALAILARLAVLPSVTVLAAVTPPVARPEKVEWDGLPVLAMAPLGDEEAAGLLAARDPALTARARAGILRRARGNPAALAELAGLAQPTLSTAFGAQIAGLPPSTRTLLLYAAAAAFPAEPALLCAAAEVPVTAWEPAEEAGLVTAAVFTHPLAAEAAYRAAPVHRRLRAHRRLAELLHAYPERRALQVAAAEPGPSEAIARALEEGAAVFRARGELYEATEAIQQAAERSDRPEDAARRLVRAIADARDLRDAAWVAELHDRVWQVTDDPDVLAEAARPAATAMLWAGRQHEAYGIIAAAHRAGPPRRRKAALHLAMIATGVAELTADEEHRLGLVSLLESAGEVPDAAVVAYVQEVIDPAAHPGRKVVDPVPGVPPVGTPLTPDDWNHLTALGTVAWFEDRSGPAARLLLRGMRDGPGTPAPAFATLPALVGSLIDTGSWGEADEYARADRAAGRLTMELSLASLRAQLCALRGDGDGARRLARETWQRMDVQGHRAGHMRLLRAVGLAAAADGDHENSYRYFRSMFDPDGRPSHPYHSPRSVAELVVAAVRCGRHEDALTVVEEVRRSAGAEPSDRMRILLHFSDALLRDDEALFRAAVGDPAASEWPYEHAVTHLHYGVWLRRHRSPREARALLSYAQGVFEGLGATGLAELASRETAVGAQTTGKVELTTQERQVAELAAQGLSNRVIADRLFISARTVSTHLSRVYRKVGVRSRRQLHLRLAPARP
ncbi:LuxR C-terminal-related transcriptional regulator [Paractinoplanes atraurantiacus]|uniref:AAA domain-containing protein n=1 Tax=Paractinoplanes atraurantiacus TaxID=1036182 RepID=A0A285JRM4_9ACTN|nr:LuxR C-terminal-related transcriptional regulator [Actinoplanes atraurantiacus]SNY62970.1 AAA domain-containing protein [Actinoplanes atraurantiacus]